MLSRFSIAATFAYQNTICFLRFQTVYYLFLILFYYFCIMFLCFFLSIYFFGYFYPVFHSQKIICIILHSKKGFLMPQFFILQHRTLLCFPLQHVSLYDILQLILLYFSETVFLAILFYDFNYSVEDIYFTEAYVMNLYAIKEKCQHGSIQVPYSYYDCGIPDYFTSVPLHWHSKMELNYIKSGNGFFKYEDQTISAKPGDIFLIQPNVLHAIMSDEHSSFFMIPLFFIRICWWEVTMTVVIQIFCCRSFLPDEEFWSLYLRKPRGIMNSMIRSGLLCSVRTKILQRLICY